MERPDLHALHSSPAEKWIEQTPMKEFYNELAEMVSKKKAKYSVHCEKNVAQNKEIPTKVSKVAARHLNDEKRLLFFAVNHPNYGL